MADYCTAEDVQVLLGMREAFGATKIPTLIQVNSIIDEVTREIDFTLASIGVTTQPTDPRVLGRLTKAAKYGTACQVGMSAFGNNTNVDDTQPGFYCTTYQAILKDITDNPGNYGLVTGDETIYMSNQVTDGTWTEAENSALYQSKDYEV